MDAAGINEKIFEFGDFRLVPREELLLRNGEQVSLNPKAFRVLSLLVQRHGHLVLKSEIIDLVWEDTFIEEGVISRAIWSVRNALGDTSKEKFIQTVPTRGYRFIYPVSSVTDISGAFRLSNLEAVLAANGGSISAENADTNGVEDGHLVNSLRAEVSEPAVSAHEIIWDAPDPAVERGVRARVRPWAAAAGIAAILLTVVVLYLTFSGRSILGTGDVRRIAVLPLKPLDESSRDKSYDLSIADALISKLGGDKKLSVRRLDSIRGYLDVDQDPVLAGKEQNVDYVLAAHYQLAGGKIKVTAQLIDVATGSIEGSYDATSDSADLFTAQNAIANTIGNNVLAWFGSDATDFRASRGTENDHAYRMYQQGVSLLFQERSGSVEKAREYLDLAVKLDPNYAKAWAAKAVAYSVMSGQGRRYDPEEKAMVYERSMEAAKRALAIDPGLSEAYTSLCENKFAYELNYAEAEKDCTRAIALDLNSPSAHRMYAMLLMSRGRSDESLAEIKTAMELEPVPISLRNQRVYASALYYARRYEEAIEAYKRLFELNPEGPATRLYLIRCLERSRREPEAFEILIKLLESEKKDDATIERFKTAYASSGWRGVLNERINTELQGRSPEYSVIAEHYGLLDEKDKAFEYLEKNLPKRGWMKMFFRVDPRFDSLRDDSRFDDILRRIEEDTISTSAR